MRVLVATSSSADDRKTLAAVRALGRSGAWVAVGADQALCAPAFSRYCARRVRYPNPAAEGAAFVDALLSEVSRGGYDVLLPLCDYTTMLASRHEGELRSHVGLAVPAYAALAQAHDKVRALRVARRAGVRTPATHAPRDVEAARALADAVSYPCVVKLRRGAGGVGLRFGLAVRASALSRRVGAETRSRLRRSARHLAAALADARSRARRALGAPALRPAAARRAGRAGTEIGLVLLMVYT